MILIIIRILLAVCGLVVIYVGLNVGVGGILTLGWQVPPSFVSVTDADAFAVQDSHVRFLGGLFALIGGLYVAGSFKLQYLRPVLIALSIILPLAGLFRFTSPAGVFSLVDLYPSLAFEFVLFPGLAIALWWTRRMEMR